MGFTRKQLGYAKALGIKDPELYEDSEELSAAMTIAEYARDFGPEVARVARTWCESDLDDEFCFAFRNGRKIEVEFMIVAFRGATVSGTRAEPIVTVRLHRAATERIRGFGVVVRPGELVEVPLPEIVDVIPMQEAIQFKSDLLAFNAERKHIANAVRLRHAKGESFAKSTPYGVIPPRTRLAALPAGVKGHVAKQERKVPDRAEATSAEATAEATHRDASEPSPVPRNSSLSKIVTLRVGAAERGRRLRWLALVVLVGFVAFVAGVASGTSGPMLSVSFVGFMVACGAAIGFVGFLAHHLIMLALGK